MLWAVACEVRGHSTFYPTLPNKTRRQRECRGIQYWCAEITVHATESCLIGREIMAGVILGIYKEILWNLHNKEAHLWTNALYMPSMYTLLALSLTPTKEFKCQSLRVTKEERSTVLKSSSTLCYLISGCMVTFRRRPTPFSLISMQYLPRYWEFRNIPLCRPFHETDSLQKAESVRSQQAYLRFKMSPGFTHIHSKHGIFNKPEGFTIF